MEVKIERYAYIEDDHIMVTFKINGCDNIKELLDKVGFEIDEDMLINQYIELLEHLEEDDYIIESNYPFFHFKVEKCRITIMDLTNEFIDNMIYILKDCKMVDKKIISEKTILSDEGYTNIRIERCVEYGPNGISVWFEINGKNSLGDLYELLKLWSVDKNELEKDVLNNLENIEKEEFILGYNYPYFGFKVKGRENIEKLTNLFVSKLFNVIDEYEKINKQQDLYRWLYKSYEFTFDI